MEVHFYFDNSVEVDIAFDLAQTQCIWGMIGSQLKTQQICYNV